MKKIISSCLMLALSLGAVIVVQRAGFAARGTGDSFDLARERFPVHVVQKTTDVYALWSRQRARGRIVVHLGRYLHFLKSAPPVGQAKSPMQITRDTSYSDILAGDGTHYNNDAADYKNFLWVASQTNIARQVYNVIPPADFIAKFGASYPSAGKGIDAEVFGCPRIISSRLPLLSEPVLLNIDASIFAGADAAKLLDTLLKSGLQADLVTVCLAQDNPDVTDLERRKTLAFIGLLSRHARVVAADAASEPSEATK